MISSVTICEIPVPWPYSHFPPTPGFELEFGLELELELDILAVKASGFLSGKSSSFCSSRISRSWVGDQVFPGGKVEYKVERETILLRHQRVLMAKLAKQLVLN